MAGRGNSVMAITPIENTGYHYSSAQNTAPAGMVKAINGADKPEIYPKECKT